MRRNDFKRNNLSLYSLGQLIKFSGRNVKSDVSNINSLISKVKKDPSQDNISELKNFFDEFLKHIEQIKKFDRKLEHQNVEKIENLIVLVLNYKLFNFLLKDEVHDVRSKFFEIIDFVIKSLKDETRSERHLLHEKRPVGSFWDNLMNSDKKLVRQEVKAGRLVDHLVAQEDNLYHQIVSSLNYIKDKKGKISHDEFHIISNLILDFVNVLKQEVALEFDVENESELEEYRIEKDLSELKKLNNKELNLTLDKLEKDYFSLIKNDVKETKRMKRFESSNLKKNLKMIKGSVKNVLKSIIPKKRVVALATLIMSLVPQALPAMDAKLNEGFNRVNQNIVEIKKLNSYDNPAFHKLSNELSTFYTNIYFKFDTTITKEDINSKQFREFVHNLKLMRNKLNPLGDDKPVTDLKKIIDNLLKRIENRKEYLNNLEETSSTENVEEAKPMTKPVQQEVKAEPVKKVEAQNIINQNENITKYELYFYDLSDPYEGRDNIKLKAEYSCNNIDLKKTKFLAYLSNGSHPFIAEDIEHFRNKILFNISRGQPDPPTMAIDTKNIFKYIEKVNKYSSTINEINLNLFLSKTFYKIAGEPFVNKLVKFFKNNNFKGKINVNIYTFNYEIPNNKKLNKVKGVDFNYFNK